MSETGGNHPSGTLPEGVSLSNPNQNPPRGIRPGGQPDELSAAAEHAATADNNGVIEKSTASRTATITGPTISIINKSTVIDAATFEATVAAVQQQLNNDFAPVWGTTARLRRITDPGQMGTYDWLLAITDDTDQAGALGYHDLTNQGQPVGYVFARTDMENNLSWSVTLSHEILEMVMDPYVSNVIFNQTSTTGGMLYAFEMCDPCEEDSMGYQINGVLVSDFVYPAYFESFRQNAKYDHQHKLTAPFSVGTGGYVSVFPIPNKTGWAQMFGQEIGARLKLKIQRYVEENSAGRTMRRVHGGINHLEVPRDTATNCVSAADLDKMLGDTAGPSSDNSPQ